MSSPFHQVRTWQEGIGYEPERGPSPKHAGTMTSDFQPPDCAKQTSVVFKTLHLDFVITVQTDDDPKVTHLESGNAGVEHRPSRATHHPENVCKGL